MTAASMRIAAAVPDLVIRAGTAPRRAATAERPALHAAAVINADAGTVRRRGAAEVERLLTAGLGSKLSEVIVTRREGLARAFDRAAAQRPDLVAVVGGDGTSRSALQALGSRVPVAPLPGGTMNLLSRQAFGRVGLEAAIAAMPHGRPRSLAAGRIDRRLFFAVAGFGPIMTLEAVREDWRRARDLRAIWRRLRALDRRAFEPDLRWSAQGREHAASALAAAIGPVDSALGLAPPAARDGFEAAGTVMRGWPDLAALASKAALRRWRGSALVTTEQASTVSVRSLAGPVAALLDGEPCRLPDEFEIRFEPRAARLWSNAASSRGEGAWTA